jgi:hypothetical protein
MDDAIGASNTVAGQPLRRALGVRMRQQDANNHEETGQGAAARALPEM